jgi:hypothetical protein
VPESFRAAAGLGGQRQKSGAAPAISNQRRSSAAAIRVRACVTRFLRERALLPTLSRVVATLDDLMDLKPSRRDCVDSQNRQGWHARSTRCSLDALPESCQPSHCPTQPIDSSELASPDNAKTGTLRRARCPASEIWASGRKSKIQNLKFKIGWVGGERASLASNRPNRRGGRARNGSRAGSRPGMILALECRWASWPLGESWNHAKTRSR